jgi:enhancing lycopene biosynthesis protein 2
MTRVGIILSGCGVFDGAEIQEAVLTMLAISREGGDYVCAAPDRDQLHVVDHRTGEVVEGETRNVLAEAARIARGEVIPLSELNVNDVDAIVLPGGYGAVKNLSTYAVDGIDMDVDPELARIVAEAIEQDKPVGFICITSVIAAKLIPGVCVTIGNDEKTAADIVSLGGEHEEAPVEDFVLDESSNVLSVPAYMLGPTIDDVASGIDALVSELMERARRSAQ